MRKKMIFFIILMIVMIGLVVSLILSLDWEKTEQKTTESMPMEVEKQETIDDSASVVHISMKEHVGCGLIWKVYDDKIIIVSNKHLLEEDFEGIVTFANGQKEKMEVMALSSELDLGFGMIAINEQSKKEIGITQVNAILSKEAWEESTYLGTNIIQISRSTGENVERTQGYIIGYEFIPEFHQFMLETKSNSRPGMSGGGIFDEAGRLLGMLSGGEIEEDSREASVTYSISSYEIEQEYEKQK